MAEASRRAARKSTRTGLPNAVFVAAGVETLPSELDGIATLVTIRFPWGSLLRGALGLDESAAASIARLVAPAGALEIAVSVEERDTIGPDRPASTFGERDVERIRRTYDSLGLQLCDVNLLDPERIDDLRSSWARRLRVDRDRRAWSLRLERAGSHIG